MGLRAVCPYRARRAGWPESAGQWLVLVVEQHWAAPGGFVMASGNWAGAPPEPSSGSGWHLLTTAGWPPQQQHVSRSGQSVTVTAGLMIRMGFMALGKLFPASKLQVPFFFFFSGTIFKE